MFFMDTITGFHRTNYCGDLRLSDVGKTVSVCGWVQRQRDLGGLIFVDLRDRTGLALVSRSELICSMCASPGSRGIEVQIHVAVCSSGTSGSPASGPCSIKGSSQIDQSPKNTGVISSSERTCDIAARILLNDSQCGRRSS